MAATSVKTDGVEGMAVAWENLGGDPFARSVTGAANSLYEIYQRDCN